MTPSFLHQTPWRCGYFNLPPVQGVRWFNPSIVQWDNRIWLAVRRATAKPPPLGMNTISLFTLNGTQISSPENKVEFLRSFANEHFEDPRLVTFNGHLFVSCTNFKIEGYKAHQILAQLDSGNRHPATAHILYGLNGATPNENKGNEKNWTWFDYKPSIGITDPKPPAGWCLVYEPWPHHVVWTNLGGPAVSYIGEVHSPCPWGLGKMRGGSPPILMGKRYWSFFHSSVDGVNPRRRYYMGAYAFEADPPFRITAITKAPLLTGSEQDGGRSDNGRPLPVIFPGGALYRNGSWMVVFGVNDERAAWIYIPHGELLDRMSNVELAVTETKYIDERMKPVEPPPPPKPKPLREGLQERLDRYKREKKQVWANV